MNNIRIWYRQLDSSLEKIQKVVPEPRNPYPEPDHFGVLPVYGFFIRHVQNIEMNNVHISYTGNETRSPVFIEDVKGIEIFRLKAQTPQNVKTIILKNVEDVSIMQSQGIKDTSIKKTDDKTF